MIARHAARKQPVRSRSAFTLLEVLVVVAILVILASVATFATVRYLEQARRSEAKLKMQKVEQAAKAYYIQYSEWPQSPQALVQPSGDGLPPLLEGGLSAISDPWGAPFGMQEGTDGNGNVRVVVTSTGSGTTLQWPER